MIVHPREVLDFWFKDTDPKLWFAEDAAFDARIRARFEETWVTARDGQLEDCSTDALARAAADRAIRHKFDLEVPAAVRAFFYLPFMHSENMGDQERSVALIGERCGKDSLNYPYATGHRDIIARFGRFPARNAALGRASTPEEAASLAKKPTP
jgi:uncharacterized protein (DUF924 family)